MLVRLDLVLLPVAHRECVTMLGSLWSALGKAETVRFPKVLGELSYSPRLATAPIEVFILPKVEQNAKERR